MVAKTTRKGPSVSDKLESARANRYKVIHERNLLILALATHGAGFSAHVVPTDDPGTWKHVLCLHTPNGEQIHWKLSPEDAADFRGLLKFDRKSDWDGARTEEKVARLEGLHELPNALITRLGAYETALRAIVDGEPSCQCDHSNDNCCAKVGEYCPACIAAVALRA